MFLIEFAQASGKRVYTKQERRQARLNSKKHKDIVPDLLANWEILRRDDTAQDKKEQLVETMLTSSKVRWFLTLKR